MNQDTKWIASKELVARTNKDGSVILMRLDESSNFYKIDGIAATVWQSLGDSKSVSELISEQSAKYPQFTQELSKDIPEFVSNLLEKQLIVQHS